MKVTAEEVAPSPTLAATAAAKVGHRALIKSWYDRSSEFTAMNIEYRNCYIGSINHSADGKPLTRKGFDLVEISIPLDFHLEAAENGKHWMLSDLTVELLVQRPDGVKWSLGSGSITGTLRSANQSWEARKIVDIRCSPRGLAQYEVFRDGAPVRMHCDVRGKIYGLLDVNGVEYLSNPSFLVGSIEIEWSREDWTNALNSCGLSTSIVVEIPLPLIKGGESEDGRNALLDAVEAFNLGGATAWKNSVGHIRPFLKKWRDEEPCPKDKTEDGSDADRNWKLLNLRDALYKWCCLSVHGTKSSCTREDALLALATFSSLLQAR